MKRLRSFLQFIVGVVVVGVLVNLATDYLGDSVPLARNLLVQVAVIGAAVWLLFLIIQYVINKITDGRYAVEALILNDNDELLVYYHPHHKRMLPPGGRVKRSEFPNDALRLRLEERIGLGPQQYTFDERVHHGLNAGGNLGRIQRYAAPFLVQGEVHRQRSFVRFHYDFVYVLKLRDRNVSFDSATYRPIYFVDEAALRDMVQQQRTFPDVLDAYVRLKALISERSTT